MTIYRATLSLHRLWLIKPSSGCWCLCITGTKPVREDSIFESFEDAKRMAHSLAHWHLEGKRYCDCSSELRWEAASASQSESSVAASVHDSMIVK